MGGGPFLRGLVMAGVCLFAAAPVVGQEASGSSGASTSRGRSDPSPSPDPLSGTSRAASPSPATAVPSAPPGAREAPMFPLGQLQLDLAGALTGLPEMLAIAEAQDALFLATGSRLWVAFIDTADPESLAGFAARTLAANLAGGVMTPSDLVLMIATDDRSVGGAIGPDLTKLTADELDQVVAQDMAPALAKSDWSGAVIAAATGLRAAIDGADAVEIPTLDGPFIDPAGLVGDAARVVALEDALERLAHETGVRLSVVLVPTSSGEPLELVAQRIRSAPGGPSGADDVLLLIATEDRAALLEPGPGLADRLSRAMLALIWGRHIRPALVDGDWARAADGAVAGIGETLVRPDLCLMDPAEVSAIIGLPLVAAVGASHQCLYGGDPTREPYAVVVGLGQILEEASLAAVRGIEPGGHDVVVAGYPGWATADGVWVDLGEDAGPVADGWDLFPSWTSAVLTVQPIIEFLPDRPELGPALEALAAEVLARLLPTAGVADGQGAAR